MKTKLLLSLFLLVFAASIARGQDNSDQGPAPAAAEAPSVGAPTLAQSPEIKPVPAGTGAAADLPKGAKPVKRETKDTLQQILSEQGTKIIAIQNNELMYLRNKEKLEAEKADVDARLQAEAQRGAAEQKIDLSKFGLDVKNWLWTPNQK